MSLWDNMWVRGNASSQSHVDDLFSPEERRRLIALRARAAALTAGETSGLNPQRLAFARWLVLHGHLYEGHENSIAMPYDSKW